MATAEVENTLPDTLPGDPFQVAAPGSEVPTPPSDAQNLGCDPPFEGLGPVLHSGVGDGALLASEPTEPSEKNGNHFQHDQNGDSTNSKSMPRPEIAAVPVPSPCRAAPVEPAEAPGTPSPSSGNGVSTPTSEISIGDIPYDGEANASRPDPGLLRLSQAAINQRMDRVFKPSKKSGDYKVSQEILSTFRSKNGKLKLQQVFQSCGYDPDIGFLKDLYSCPLL